MDLRSFRKNLAQECDFNPPNPEKAFAALKEKGEYVPLFENREVLGHDPAQLLFDAIYLATGPTHQLLSGFRGASKTTTLLRLQEDLVSRGFTAVRIDVEDYLSTAVPPGPVEFLLFIAVAFEEAMNERFPRPDMEQNSIWARVKAAFQRIDVDVEPVEVAVEKQFGPVTLAAKFKLLLKDDAFVQQLRKSAAGTLPALAEAIRDGMRELVAEALRKSPVPDGAVVLLVDSVEHYRGNIQTASDIQAAVQMLFDVHAGLLRFDIDNLHVIYTVPPYLRELVPNAPSSFGTPNVRIIPAVKIFDRNGNRHEPGFEVMRELATRRIEAALKRSGGGSVDDVISRDQLDRVVEASGGLPREVLRVLHELNLQLGSLPVEDRVIDRVLTQLVAGRGALPDEDALLLARVDAEHTAPLENMASLPTFARLLEYGSVLCYQNDDDWYAVNPLLRPLVNEHVERIRARTPSGLSPK